MSDPFIQPLQKALAKNPAISLHTPHDAAAVYTAIRLAQKRQQTIIILTDGARSLDAIYQDIHTLLGPKPSTPLLYFPGWEALPGKQTGWSQDLAGDRLQTLQACRKHQGPALITTSIQAIMQRTMPPEHLDQATQTIHIGGHLNLEKLSTWLDEQGYEFTPEVEQKGDVTRRGGLLDIWPPDQVYPLRLELFGDQIESIRQFDPADQRSVGHVKTFNLSPAIDAYHMDATFAGGTFFDFLPHGSCWIIFDSQSITHHAQLFERALIEAEKDAYFIDWEKTQNTLRSRKKDKHINLVHDTNALQLALTPVESIAASPHDLLEHQHIDKERNDFVQRIIATGHKNTTFHFHTQGALTRFKETQFPQDIPANVHLSLSPLTQGFTLPHEGLAIISESDIYGTRKIARNKYDPHAKTRQGPQRITERISDWADIEPGDLVVHIDHGVGKYLGLYETNFQGQQQESLVIEYANDARISLPVSQAHLLSKYVGVGKTRPQLHKIGGTRWNKEKATAQRAIQDLAADMLQTQALRQTLPGHAYATDTPWQEAFEATFPYQETTDQLNAIESVKAAMEQNEPMDHLICGDVGYGKTEIAMRTAFKAVMDGKQVALLVPTTILAQQHYQAFCERMAAFPVTIEMLSRFRTKARQNHIVQQLHQGQIDIIIGTHRLAQSDIHFKDLGLVIIDEEQRFGVAVKEKLKNHSKLVDVITLTATPIPRTLYLSLTGARHMSVISTPPQARLPIQTIVAPYSNEHIRAAILLELNREGQVFYLHNRVKTIESTHRKLKKLIPEARIEYAHGQLSERELENTVQRFINAEFDVLLCTTIIESGVDIPNANTIIIDRADRFGLADLYQLRGRVGRDKHQAYAYLLLPQTGPLRHEARSRIQAMEKYSSLGAGFKLALRDLETRGAGNLLGSEQSGHITAVGFDLYCQLLDRTVRHLKKQPIPPIIDVDIKLDFIDLSPNAPNKQRAAMLPTTYMEDEKRRVELYRRISGLTTLANLDRMRKELHDRFGRAPTPVRNLLKISEIRIRAAAHHITEIQTRQQKLMLKHATGYHMLNKRFPTLKQHTPNKKLDEILTHLRNHNPKKP